MMPTGNLECHLKLVQITVSILVLLDDAYRPKCPTLVAESVKVFQSLFFWMMPTGAEGFKDDVVLVLVSILVLLDDAYRPVFKIAVSTSSMSFNPCSSG